MIRLSVVEDNKVLSNSVKEILAATGEITQAYDDSEGLFELESGVYDLAILDLTMSEMNGYEVLVKIRKGKIQTPVLILAAKDSLEDKIRGFERGVDDYLTKSFYQEELIMRVKALLKHSLGLFDENVLKYKDTSHDLKSNEVLYEEQVLPIQGEEFGLLVYFLQNKGIVLTKEQVFDRVWGFDSDTTITVIEVYMSNLRGHLRNTGLNKRIKILRNVGYILQRVWCSEWRCYTRAT